MNEVMTIAVDNQLNIWYQDTDSMHIDYEQVETLATLFQEHFNGEWIGKHMGQFHIDFVMDGAVDAIHSIEAYCIVKQVYIDIIGSRNEQNNILQDSHIRLKRVPTSCITYIANNEHTTHIDLFQTVI